jgi:transcriptional regulator with XRE-family HTH domain
VDVERLRRRIGLTQTSLARLLGVTQPAVAAWERGARRPTGRPALLLERLEATFAGPVRAFPAHRGRPVRLPAERWEQPIVPPDDMELPLRLDWSPRAGRRTRSNRSQRAGLYAQVLDEGSPSDIRIWIDPDELVELWPDLPIARHLRGPVGELVAELQQT